jgi:hypothetical protein
MLNEEEFEPTQENNLKNDTDESSFEEEEEEELLNVYDDVDFNIDITIEISDSLDFNIDTQGVEIIGEIDELKEEIVEIIAEDDPLSKHKQQGKHSLKYDSIFKGKREALDENDVLEQFNETFDLDKSSLFYFETRDNEAYLRQKSIKEKIYAVLSKKTDINFLNNRRKPSKVDFNDYFFLIKEDLKNEHFTSTEIFNELSFYFSDNLFNMFKLLDNKWRNEIISDLHEHIGKSRGSKEIKNRNIYQGTEVEFITINIIGEEKIFSGVVIDVNYEESQFKIDSFENIYDIHISSITKILNNTKFKNNLNRLDNIDFL